MSSNRILPALVIVLATCLHVPAARAQGEQQPARGPFGFVRLVNAVAAGTGKLEFEIDGKTIRPAGYRLGDVTGGIALKPATCKVTFRREGVKKGETQVRVKADETTILIPFAEQVPATDKEPAHWEIRILRLKQHGSEEEPVASFVSVSKEPELKVEMRQADGKWEAVFVERLSVARTKIKQSRGYVTVRCKGHEISTISVGAAGNFVSILYEDEDGVLRSKTFQDYKYLSAD